MFFGTPCKLSVIDSQFVHTGLPSHEKLEKRCEYFFNYEYKETYYTNSVKFHPMWVTQSIHFPSVGKNRDK